MEVGSLKTIEYINLGINYIEKNIKESLEIEEIAKAAYLSKHYFQRVFHVVIGMTVSDYIRNRKLSLAAEELLATDKSVTEVALDYGYENSDAFAKAFRRLQGVTPSAIRKGEAKLKIFPRITLQVNVTGESEMNYRIVEKDAFKMMGIAMQRVSKEESDIEVKKFCERVWDDGSHHQLTKYLGFPIMHMLDGVYFDYKEDGSRRYFLGCEIEDLEVPEEYEIIHVPAHQWIVFEYEADMTNPVAISELWKRIYVEWMPSSTFEQVEGLCIERYFWKDEQYFEYRCEVWIPVIKRVKE